MRRSLASGGVAEERDQGNNLINLIERLEEAFQDMGTGLGLAQFELGTPDHHFAAMVEEIGQRGLEVQQHRGGCPPRPAC